MAEPVARVLDAIQGGFPLEHDPYRVLGERLGLSRAQVLGAVSALRRDGIIRRVGASFVSRRLGYSSTLCALAVPGGRAEADRVARIVNGYPNVTHNYLRDHRYNLWFTVIARDAGEVGRIAADIERRSGHAGILNLPATAVYKIRVDFGGSSRGCGGGPHPASAEHRGGLPAARPSDRIRPFDGGDPFDVALVRWGQEDVSGLADGGGVDPEPFASAAMRIAREPGAGPVDEGRVLERLRELRALGVIRRFGALVAHRRIGYAFNGMTVWDVPPERLDRVGAAFAAERFVSHCYARPRSAAWPYSLYAMVHAQTHGQLDAYVARLRETAAVEPRVLLSTREYKKSSMRYFSEGGSVGVDAT